MFLERWRIQLSLCDSTISITRSTEVWSYPLIPLLAQKARNLASFSCTVHSFSRCLPRLSFGELLHFLRSGWLTGLFTTFLQCCICAGVMGGFVSTHRSAAQCWPLQHWPVSWSLALNGQSVQATHDAFMQFLTCQLVPTCSMKWNTQLSCVLTARGQPRRAQSRQHAFCIERSHSAADSAAMHGNAVKVENSSTLKAFPSVSCGRRRSRAENYIVISNVQDNGAASGESLLTARSAAIRLSLCRSRRRLPRAVRMPL